MTRSNVWFEVFSRLSEFESRVVIRFWLSTGADFYMSAPREGEINKNGFSENLEFMHSFDEIEKIEFPKEGMGKRFGISNPVTRIFETLRDIDGLTLELSEDGLLTTLNQS